MKKSHYAGLDNLRGIAAICVLLFHRREWFGGENFMAHAYLGVDFFFLLSGFVVSHAYRERLAAGMRFGDFLLRRVIRLYPLIVVGSLLGAAALLMRTLTRGNPLPEFFPLTVVMSMLTLPAAWDPKLWPIDPPIWSLFFEMGVSIVFGLGAFALGKRALGGVVAVSLAILVFCCLAFGSLSMGNEGGNFWAGFPRVAFPFFLGVALQRLHEEGFGRGFRIAAPLAGVALVASFTLLPQGSALAPYYDLLCAVVLFPVLVFGVANVATGPLETRISKISGDLSYPLYILHFPLLWIFSAIGKVLLARDNVGPIYGAVACLLIIAISWAALKLYDEPVRAFLTARLSPRRPPAEPTPVEAAFAATLPAAIPDGAPPAST
ncbi:MAG: acyltransferase [Caulobacter sp.]